MKKILRSLIATSTFIAGAASTEMLNPTTADATPVYTCTNKNGGPITPNDFDISAVQHSVGAVEDGIFSSDTCDKTIKKVIEEGHVRSTLTTLMIGDKVLSWLGANNIGTSTVQETPKSSTTSCILDTTADIKAVQMTLGVSTDGNFGRQSCTTLISRLHALGLIDKNATSATLTNALAEKMGVDNDTIDRAACKIIGKCILVQAVLGKNMIELYSDGLLIDTTLVNTGIKGMRTRNGDFSLGADMFSGDGVHISRDDRGDLLPGRMGDPRKISGGQAFHWRVNYGNSVVGTSLAKDVSFPYTDWKPSYENNTYNGGYASHGCVHTPHWMLMKYDNSYFVRGVKVAIRDQPKD
jgi:hypothetical protein